VQPNLQADASTYDRLARDLASSWQLAAVPPRHPPVWIISLAFVYSLAGASFVAGKLISWASLIASVALGAWLARRIYGAGAAWMCAALTAASPALRAYVGTLQYEVLTGAMLLGTLAIAAHTADSKDRRGIVRGAALTGVLAAVLILTRETFVVAVVVIALWLWSRLRAFDRPLAARAALIAIAIALAPAVAWSALQSVREGRLITISEKGPLVIELGNNPLANGTYNAPLVGVGQPTGLAFVRTDPGRSLVLAGRKILYFWGVLRDGWTVPHPAAVWVWRATTGLLPLKIIESVVRGGWLLAAFAVSLWLLGRDRLKLWWALPAIVLTILIVHIVTLASYRFAVPILPVVYVLVSGPLARLTATVGRALRAPAVGAAAALLCGVIVAMQFKHWPLRVDYAAADLDGISADNTFDGAVHHQVRFADSRRGERPVVLLPDEYLPRGPLTVTLRARRSTQAEPSTTPVARLALVQLDGTVGCSADFTAGQIPADFRDLSVSCRLAKDGPATLLVDSLGKVDLAFDRVALVWQ